MSSSIARFKCPPKWCTHLQPRAMSRVSTEVVYVLAADSGVQEHDTGRDLKRGVQHGPRDLLLHHRGERCAVGTGEGGRRHRQFSGRLLERETRSHHRVPPGFLGHHALAGE